jgi:hypothetical protein
MKEPTLPQTTAVAGDQWTPKTLMEACMHIRSLEEERETFRQEAIRWRSLLQDVVDDMTFHVAPSKGTMAKIEEAMKDV